METTRLLPPTSAERLSVPASPNSPEAVTPAMARPGTRVDLKSLYACVLLGFVLWLIPAPDDVPQKGWNLFCIFASTIAAIIAQPLDVGAIALLALGVTMITKVLTFSEAFSAFSTDIPWLIATAFFLSRGFINTGLGNRMAYTLVAATGHSSLSLTYSLVLAELVLAPAIPSVAARTGGIFAPIVEGLSVACGSDPKDKTERRLGTYLVLTMFQTSCISSCMFLTAMAANPLSAKLAEEATGQPAMSWGGWAVAAFVPGMLCVLSTPLVVFAVCPPEIKSTPNAPDRARAELRRLGTMSEQEGIMAITLLVTVLLWVLGGVLGINSVSAALVGLGILLVTGVVTWKQCLAEAAAWDTLVWFAALVAMATHLSQFGFIGWLCKQLVEFVTALGFQSWPPAFVLVSVLYFYAHYLFASATAHIGAMYTAFLTVLLGVGTPPALAAFTLSIFSNLMGGLTHFGFGSAPAYYGLGYAPLKMWWRVGFACSVLNVAVFLLVGPLWWRLVGVY